MVQRESLRFRMRLCAPLILSVLVAGNGCTSGDPRGPAMGTDYFATDFRCTSGILAHERNSRYELIYNSIRQKFAAETKQRGRAPIVLTGDSTSMLFTPELLKKELPEFDIANRGIAGDTSRLLLARVTDITALAPQTVIVAIGGNDLLAGRCIPDILDNTIRFIGELESKGVGRILLVSVPPVLTWKANSISPFYNDHLRRLAARRPKVIYVDLWQELAAADLPMLKDEYQRAIVNKKGKDKKDSVHFNEAGYGAWARLLRQALKAR